MIFSILVLFCLLVLIAAFLLLPGESTATQRQPFWGGCFAHRGLHSKDKLVPENSMAAFTAAIDQGYGIEIDIQLSKDGQVVVFHDDSLERVCHTSGNVNELAYSELRLLSIEKTAQRIPLLRDVLNLVDQQIPILLELKTCKNYKELCQNTWNILKTYDGDFCVQSFDPRIVRWFKQHVPGILRGQLAAQPAVLKAGVGGVLVGWGFANCIGRPQFISYQAGKIPFTMGFARKFAMTFGWTVRPAHTLEIVQQENDAIIFEYITPEPQYKILEIENIESDATIPDTSQEKE